MSISALPGSGSLEEKVEQQQLRDQFDDLDISGVCTDVIPPLCECCADDSLPLCGCCLKGCHFPELCPYMQIVPEGKKVGPGFRLCCKKCFAEEFHPDELQTCVNCGNTAKMAFENECNICGENRGHLEDACEYRDFVDWTPLETLGYMSPPYLDADALDEAQRLKALQDAAKGVASGKAT